MTKTEEIRVWSANKGYVRYNGAIQHIVVNKITVRPDLDIKMFEIDCVIGGVAMELEFEYLPCLYYNEDDCKNEKNAMSTCWLRTETHEQCIRYFWNSKLMEVHSVYMSALVRELTFNGSFWVEKIIDDRELFEDADMCKYAQDIPVTEADGSTHINKGLRSRLALNDEQKALVKQYEEVCKKMKEANVRMIFANDKTYAYNTSEIKYLSACYSYGDLCDDEYEECEVSEFCTRVEDYVDMGGWDDGLYVKLPKKEEKQSKARVYCRPSLLLTKTISYEKD